ncbi:hypothetical protein H2O64_15375 [Kordia sp. YSTF-M3]|uniref:Uncharacterized protein n=1 Tax=Kordia aestuariivivens TaxID=2759037 RepID=A0ABR7QC51_9FLAO|nr:hypothetical protein [Kordia aestuariivivens]MBC8756058.1 hypothetical protein [Kordia aestuariivivens]
MIVGNKSVFGFEYKVTDDSLFYGNGRIWFGENPICTFEDETHLIHLVNGLKRIRNSKKLSNYNISSIDNIFDELMKRTENIDDEQIYDYVISFGASSDDFLIFSFSLGNYIYILWKIIVNKSVFDDINILSKSVYHFKIKKMDYDKTMSMIITKVPPRYR